MYKRFSYIIKNEEQNKKDNAQELDRVCRSVDLKHTRENMIYPGIFIGDVFSFLTVIRRTEPKIYSNQKKAMILCKCECGNEHTVNARKLLTGKTKSCGCRRYSLDNKVEHVHYKRASKILQRCNNPSSDIYKDYGGRGIKCLLGNTTWEVARSLDKVPGFSIKDKRTYINREDNDGDYTLFHPIFGDEVWYNKDGIATLGNLNWVTNKYNNLNRRDNLNDEIISRIPRRRWEFKEYCRIRNIDPDKYEEILVTDSLNNKKYIYKRKN